MNKYQIFDATPVMDTLALAAGDVMSSTTKLTWALRERQVAGRLRSIVITDEDDQGIALDVVFFDRNVSLGATNAAPAISDSDARATLGVISIVAGDYVDFGGVRVATKSGLDLFLRSRAAIWDLYFGLITRGAPTHTASGLKFKFGIEI